MRAGCQPLAVLESRALRAYRQTKWLNSPKRSATMTEQLRKKGLPKSSIITSMLNEAKPCTQEIGSSMTLRLALKVQLPLQKRMHACLSSRAQLPPCKAECFAHTHDAASRHCL